MLLDDVLLVKRPVLVVDDQEINREILGMILEESFEVKFATNGREALDYVRREGNRLSVILLDLVMPVMDGYEVIRELKKDPELSHIPIIVLTAETTAELETLQLGASAFITKPFEEDEVIVARVARIVELSETKRLIRATEKDDLTGLTREHAAGIGGPGKLHVQAHPLVIHCTDPRMDVDMKILRHPLQIGCNLPEDMLILVIVLREDIDEVLIHPARNPAIEGTGLPDFFTQPGEQLIHEIPSVELHGHAESVNLDRHRILRRIGLILLQLIGIL